MKTALITGASGGIGLELCQLFAHDGYQLILVAREKEKLEKLSHELNLKFKIQSTSIAIDLSNPGAPKELFEKVSEKGLTVDALVNNAGFGLFGPFHETSLQQELQMIQVNIVTLTELTKYFLPGMLKNKNGKILNVASTAAFQPGPLMAVYYASKAYVLSFSEALAEETQGTGVTVTALCPGPTQTGFQQQAKMEESKLIRGKLTTAKEVAEAGYQALMSGKRVQIVGFKNLLLAQSIRFMPRRMVTCVVKKAQEKVV